MCVDRFLTSSDNVALPVITQLPRKDGCLCTACNLSAMQCHLVVPTATSAIVRNMESIYSSVDARKSKPW